jgi:glycosyltransferase involved in cell wall biosynthesis
VVANLASALSEAGAEVAVFVPRSGQGWLERRLSDVDVTIEKFGLDQPVSPAFARWLAGAFRRLGIQVAHSHEFSCAVYGAFAARQAGIGHVITMHGGRYYAGRVRRRLALRVAIALTPETVAVSARLRRCLRRDLLIRESKITVVPNGVPPLVPAMGDLRRELGLAPEARILLAVGNLYPVKGHHHLIGALHRISSRHPDAHVVVAGRGEQEAALLEQAGSLGLRDRVHLLGLRADIPRLLAAADVFVLPSISEGLPIAILEAMFAGRPIIASDVGDLRYALDDGRAGRLVPPADEPALAAALHDLLSNPPAARALGEQARLRANAEFQLDTMVARYVALYRRAMARAGHRAFP